jgi:ABC-2 type transport system ATP-binding protein
VCGIVRPTAGQASVLGHDVVRDAVAARKLIGLVPQEINFDPFFSPREVLRFQMGYYGVARDDARIDEVLGALGLADKADTNARALSGGMRRRLLIAKALVHRPRVVFLDEPTAGVDVALRRELWQYVRQLRAQGSTIVLTTHYLEEAEALADRVAVIDRGTLITLDTPAQLLRQHGRRRLRVTLAAPLPEGGVLPEALLRAGATIDEGRHALTCSLEGGDVASLLGALAALGHPVADVETEHPSLEQVFIQLTARPPAAAPAGRPGPGARR